MRHDGGMALIRYRMAVIVAAILVIVVATAVRLAEPPAPIGDVATGLTFAAVIALVVGFGMGRLAPTLIRERPTLTVRSPVRGRWLAMNSPATHVPSHGVHSYGQAHAIDLVAEPDGVERPAFGDGPSFRAPADFHAFGQSVHAMVAGTVVSASHRHRDHRSRSSTRRCCT